MNQSSNKSIITIQEESISNFSNDVESLWMIKHKPTIQTVHTPPTPLEFLREYVNLSTPVLIKNVFPTITLDELINNCENSKYRHSTTTHYTHFDNDVHECDEDGNLDSIANLKLNVDVTPDGHGDTIRIVDGKEIFVMPQVQTMTFSEFRKKLRKNKIPGGEENDDGNDNIERDENGRVVFSSSSTSKKYDASVVDDNDDDDVGVLHDHEVVYYSRQNDCLREELKPLTSYFPKHIPFATEAFNVQPDAINLWVGNECSISSMHKDHYENIFCVSSGQKIFTICPPADAIFIEEKLYPSGVFRHGNCGWVVDIQKQECCSKVDSDDNEGTEKDEEVRWIGADVERIMEDQPLESRLDYLQKFPKLKHAHPMKVVVEAGDMFYLPSLWYHRVTQSCETVAVNYWYDMRFDSPHWCYFNFLQHLNSKTEID